MRVFCQAPRYVPMSGISACKHIWTPMKRRSQQPDGIFRVCPQTEFAHFRPQRGRFKTAWMFVQNLLDEHWKKSNSLLSCAACARSSFSRARCYRASFQALESRKFPCPAQAQVGRLQLRALRFQSVSVFAFGRSREPLRPVRLFVFPFFLPSFFTRARRKLHRPP